MNIEDKLVRVEWVDSSTSSPWVLLEDFKDEQCDPIKIVSYGIIVKETDDYLVIAQNYGSNPPQISNTTAIPKGCIIQQNIIKEESKMEEKKTLEELAQPLKNWLVEHNDEVPSSKIVIDKYSVVVIQEIMGGSLNKTIEEPKQEENDQKCEPFRIKKGEWYVCIHDFCNKAIRIGEIIQAEHDDTIRGIGFLYMENKYFRPAFENEIPQKPKWTDENECPKWFEKPGEKPQGKTALEAIMEEKSPAESLGISPEEYERMVNECIYGESTDKLKPKFKVGDWVVSKTSNLVYHVDSILLPQSKCYYLSHDGGLVIVSFTDEQNYHLWTIQDAKDGDVLTTQGSVFIFKHLDKTGRSLCKSYCEVIDNSGLGLGFEFSINGVCPATKEQRELLFAKMKEAGYEWDETKKELKKIEQKSTDKVEPKFHVGEWIVWKDKYYKVNYNGCGYELIDQNGLSTSLEYGTVDKNARLLSIKDVKSSAKTCKNDTLLDLLHKMPSCITVDGIDYHFVMKKTIAFMAFYEGEGEGSGKVIFWMAGEPVPLLTAMLEKLKNEGLLE